MPLLPPNSVLMDCRRKGVEISIREERGEQSNTIIINGTGKESVYWENGPMRKNMAAIPLDHWQEAGDLLENEVHLALPSSFFTIQWTIQNVFLGGVVKTLTRTFFYFFYFWSDFHINSLLYLYCKQHGISRCSYVLLYSKGNSSFGLQHHRLWGSAPGLSSVHIRWVEPSLCLPSLCLLMLACLWIFGALISSVPALSYGVGLGPITPATEHIFQLKQPYKPKYTNKHSYFYTRCVWIQVLTVIPHLRFYLHLSVFFKPHQIRLHTQLSSLT